MVDLAEGSDVVVGSRLLATELVGGEPEDLETLLMVLLVELLKASVLFGLARAFEASLARPTWGVKPLLGVC